jgi:hypothetical protein
LSIVEVQSLSGINGTYFPSTPANWYWSSSPVAGSPSKAWLVYFGYGDGLSYSDVVSKTYNIRCVR